MEIVVIWTRYKDKRGLCANSGMIRMPMVYQCSIIFNHIQSYSRLDVMFFVSYPAQVVLDRIC